jgi:hypothetical protein
VTDRRRYGRWRGGADEEQAELEALLEGASEGPGGAWRSRVAHWGADPARRARGRELLAAGAVRALRVEPGRISAEVVGAQVYRVQVVVRPPSRWEVDAMRPLLIAPTPGRASVSADVTRMLDALVRTMVVACTCPDGWGCKHAVAALLAFAPRLDAEPSALLTLWGAAEPAAEERFAPAPLPAGKVALRGDLGALFGIDLVDTP